jgi:eukaryotic-like serine/threonine-protein kinase
MPAPTSIAEFLELVQKSGVVDEKKLEAHLERVRSVNAFPANPQDLAGILVRDGLLTLFQAKQLLQGKWRRFTLGKYKILEELGSGGMGSVYLCEHKLMRRRVALKVLPRAKADDPSSLERFYREARAVAALDHPNIVRAYDIDQEDKLHFLVMEYVDGASLQEVIKRKNGPMDPTRAAHYMRQAALGLQHAHENGLIHRDIKPGNVLIDRNGTVKVLDMGLARFFNDEEDILTKKYDENVLGTADYLAPEQALDSHSVDIRADIYSLGATFYFCLTGRTPFSEGTVAQKLIWHQTRQPKPIRQLRPEVPEGLVAVVEKMMAKDPGQRYQTPLEVAEALAPWTQTPITAPPEDEMPRLSLAAMGTGPGTDSSQLTMPRTSPGGMQSPSPHKGWQVPRTPPRTPAVKPPPPPQPPSPRSPRNPPPGPPTAQAAAPAVAAPPNNGMVAAAALQAVQEAEEIPWEKLSRDTDNHSARADTAPRSGHKPALERKPKAMAAPAAAQRPPWWILALLAGMAVVAVIVLVSIAFLAGLFGRGGGTATNQPFAANKLYVGKDAPYHHIADALRAVKPGQHIVVQDDLVEEQLVAEEKEGQERFKDVTIEPAGDRPFVWRFPKNLPAEDRLVLLNNLPGFRLRKITFDGDNRVLNLAIVFGHCPGLTLDEVHFQGFKRCALLFNNCEGEPDRPVLLQHVRFVSTHPETEAAVLFNLTPSLRSFPNNKHITFSDCRFEGPYKDATPIKNQAAALQSVELRGRNVAVTAAGQSEGPVQLPK